MGPTYDRVQVFGTGSRHCEIARPDRCPHCELFVDARYREVAPENDNVIHGLAMCPAGNCKRIFSVVLERSYGDTFEVSKYYPPLMRKRNFGEIAEHYPEFARIYTQASQAESMGLDEISGPGYRKALEFLIKPYLIKMFPAKSEEISAELLSASINRIDNQRLKSMATKASWLGNDEVHFTRIWKNKDIQDLKKLVDLTVNHIDQDLIYESFGDMVKLKEPKGAKK